MVLPFAAFLILTSQCLGIVASSKDVPLGRRFLLDAQAIDGVSIGSTGFSNDGTAYHVKFEATGSERFEVDCALDVKISFESSDVATIEGIEPRKVYDCEVRGVSNVTNGPWTPFSFETPDDSPGQVIIVSHSSWKTAATFRLSSTLVKTFEMTCVSDENSDVKILAVTSPVSWGIPGSFDASFDDLQPGTSYSCEARGVGLSGTKGNATAVRFSTPPDDSYLPLPVVVKNVSEGTNSSEILATLSENSTSYGSVCYRFAIPMEPVESTVSFEGFDVKVKVENALTNSKFACEIFGINDVGEGPHTRVEFATSSGIPPPVRITKVVAGSTTAYIHAIKSFGAFAYGVDCWDHSLDPSPRQISVSRDDLGGGEIRFSLSNLSPGSLYDCRIRSIGERKSPGGGVAFVDAFVTKG